MNKEIVKAWNEHNPELLAWLKETKQSEYSGYEILLKKTLECLFPNENAYGMPDKNRVTEINYGDYQGTLVYVIGGYGYQPSPNNHWYTCVYYGSCSGCDTLKGIRSYEDGRPSDIQAQEYWELCLHMIQHMKRMDDTESEWEPEGAKDGGAL